MDSLYSESGLIYFSMPNSGFKKSCVISLTLFAFCTQIVSAGTIEQNARLKLLLERAKARQEGRVLPESLPEEIKPIIPAVTPLPVSPVQLVSPVVVPTQLANPILPKSPISPVVEPALLPEISKPVIEPVKQAPLPEPSKPILEPARPSQEPIRKEKILQTHPDKAPQEKPVKEKTQKKEKKSKKKKRQRVIPPLPTVAPAGSIQQVIIENPSPKASEDGSPSLTPEPTIIPEKTKAEEKAQEKTIKKEKRKATTTKKKSKKKQKTKKQVQKIKAKKKKNKEKAKLKAKKAKEKKAKKVEAEELKLAKAKLKEQKKQKLAEIKADIEAEKLSSAPVEAVSQTASESKPALEPKEPVIDSSPAIADNTKQRYDELMQAIDDKPKAENTILEEAKEVEKPAVEEKPVAETPATPKPELPAEKQTASAIKQEEIPVEKPKTETAPPAPPPAAASDKNADYLLVMRKSLKSLEEDTWADVKYNMGEALDYFAKEKQLNPTVNLDVYQKVSLAFQRFSEGGLELDQGDFADFEEAEALYLDCQDILSDAMRQLGKSNDYNAQALKDIVQSGLKYTEEELHYIEEMLGLE